MNTLLLIVAVVLFVVAALLAFAVVSSGVSVLGLLALGLACFAAAHLPLP